MFGFRKEFRIGAYCMSRSRVILGGFPGGFLGSLPEGFTEGKEDHRRNSWKGHGVPGQANLFAPECLALCWAAEEGAAKISSAHSSADKCALGTMC
jgi:hypothetical protein